MSSPQGGPLPVATYRLQFRDGMDFAKAADLVPYLARLGVSHLYASPIFKARSGSTHGYDVADPTTLDPDLGGQEGFAVLGAALERHGVGLLLDIVPNHLGVGPDNPWWQDLLRWGKDSANARFFDIDWQALAGGTPGRLLLPQLGSPYGEVLERGELAVAVERDPPGLAAAYYDNRYPLDPRTWPLVLEGLLPETLLVRLRAAGPDGWAPLAEDLAEPWRALPDRLDLPGERLHALLEAQSWRLAWWRSGNATLNWRRFFDITELAGLRIEDERVFEAAHALVLDLYAKGQVAGLRIDHVDGLAEPGRYLERLAASMREARPKGPEPWILVEKILGEDEDLPESWPVAGTTGYEMANLFLGLFVDRGGQAALDRTYRGMGGDPQGFRLEVAAAKKEILETALLAELRRLTARLAALAREDMRARDLPLGVIAEALKAVVGAFRVYRTYGGEGAFAQEDRERLEAALKDGEAALGLPDPFVFRFLEDVLLRRGPHEPATRAVLKAFEQLTGPAMAKSLEDTAFYRWHRLVALNEVGGEPDRFGVEPQEAHAFLQERARRWPRALVATATHDTKRGEDTRLRIAALSERAEDWDDAVRSWTACNEAHKIDGLPDRPTEYLFYQMLVGAFPVELDGRDRAAGLETLADRLVAYLEKACREAKRHTSWLAPNQAYETAVAGFVRAVLDPDRNEPFLRQLAGFLERLGPLGARNGIAQTVLKLTVPGVPDVYQGTEFWDQSTVDPDNRRPVDWAARERALDEDRSAQALLATWRDGRIKQRLIRRLLALRNRHPDVFTRGRYLPLSARGVAAERVFAFARQGDDGAVAVVAVARLTGALGEGSGGLAPVRDAWGDTALVLPKSLATKAFTSILDDRSFQADRPLPVGRLFGALPAAVLFG